MNLGPYGKAVVAALATASIVLSDNVFNAPDVIEIVLAVLGALGVYAIRNVPEVPPPPPYQPTHSAEPPV